MGIVVALKQHVFGQSCRDEASLHLVLSRDGISHKSTTKNRYCIVHAYTNSSRFRNEGSQNWQGLKQILQDKTTEQLVSPAKWFPKNILTRSSHFEMPKH